MTKKKIEGWINYTQQAYKEVNLEERYISLALEKEGNFIGTVGIGPKKEINNQIEIAYFLSQEFCNKGYVAEAVKAMIWWAFEVVKIDYLTAIARPGNKPSQKVVEKAGFIKGDTILVEHDGENKPFHFYKLYHIDHIPDPEWNFHYPAEDMGKFFNKRADGYNDHMHKLRLDFEGYKRAMLPIPSGNYSIDVLDFGCGTGIELEYMFLRVPNAKVTCIDLTPKMLENLRVFLVIVKVNRISNKHVIISLKLLTRH